MTQSQTGYQEFHLSENFKSIKFNSEIWSQTNQITIQVKDKLSCLFGHRKLDQKGFGKFWKII